MEEQVHRYLLSVCHDDRSVQMHLHSWAANEELLGMLRLEVEDDAIGSRFSVNTLYSRYQTLGPLPSGLGKPGGRSNTYILKERKDCV